MQDWKTPFEYDGARKIAFGLIGVYVVGAIGLSIAHAIMIGGTGLAGMIVVACSVPTILLLSEQGRKEFIALGGLFLILTIFMIVAIVELFSAS
ncbi:hypothetical protein L5876_08765 [Hyphobacterium sp. SN044]|uniref:hypothetical protein n=1 Tax=Hyphobacterium sp. SN044 TaxID=2912575 RepID=UPI001F3D1819|nr:hypothetical protein [Hyphobacterium sp. SN044]MCF8879902.1 hypothetical protein [Hyphobacterium sp. SN044]